MWSVKLVSSEFTFKNLKSICGLKLFHIKSNNGKTQNSGSGFWVPFYIQTFVNNHAEYKQITYKNITKTFSI